MVKSTLSALRSIAIACYYSIPCLELENLSSLNVVYLMNLTGMNQILDAFPFSENKRTTFLGLSRMCAKDDYVLR